MHPVSSASRRSRPAVRSLPLLLASLSLLGGQVASLHQRSPARGAPLAKGDPPASAPEAPPPHYDDARRIAALGRALSQNPSPEAAAALGDLLLLAGRGPEAAKAFATARALLARDRQTLRMEVVKEGHVRGLSWQGDTLAVTRQLASMRLQYQLLGTRLEIWEAAGRGAWAPRLSRTLTRGGPSVAWTGPQGLWWRAGPALLHLDTLTGRPERTLATGDPTKTQPPWFSASVALATRSGHLAAVIHSQLVRVWTPAGEVAREVTLTGTTPKTIRANMGDHCEMRTVQMQVEATKVALSPDGRRLAVAATDARVRLVEVGSGRQILLKQEWEPMHYGLPRNPFAREHALVLRFSEDGRRLVLVQADSSVTTWDAASGRRISRWQVPCPEASEAAVRARLGKAGRQVDKWSLRHAQSDAREGCHNVHGGDLSLDAKTLVTARHRVSLFAIPDGARREGPKVAFSSMIAMDPKGRTLAASNQYRGAEVWSLAPLGRQAHLDGPTVFGQVADLSPDGRFLAIWHDDETWTPNSAVSIWDLQLGSRLGQVRAWNVDAVRFAYASTPRLTWPAGNHQVGVGAAGGGGASAGVAGKPPPGNRPPPGTDVVLVLGREGRVELWSLAPLRLARTLVTGTAGRAAFTVSPEAQRLVVSGFTDGRLRVVALSGGPAEILPGRVDLAPFNLVPPPMAISSDGRRLAAASEDGVRVWDLGARRLLRHQPAREAQQQVNTGRWHRRGHGGAGGAVTTQKVTLRPKAVALSRDGRTLALSEAQGLSVRLVDVASGRELAFVPTTYDADALLFAPGDRELIVSGIGVFGRWRPDALAPKTGRGARSPAVGAAIAPLVPIQAEGRHLSLRRLALGAGGRVLLSYDFHHRHLIFWTLGGPRLLADLWPVTGGHWVALSDAGRVDASPVGRHALLTFARSADGKSDVGYGWGLGWDGLRQPDLVPRAATGRLSTP